MTFSRDAEQGSLDRDDRNYVNNSEWDLLSVTFDQRLRRRRRQDAPASQSDGRGRAAARRLDRCNSLLSTQNNNSTSIDDDGAAAKIDCRDRATVSGRGGGGEAAGKIVVVRATSRAEEDTAADDDDELEWYTELKYELHIRRRSFYFAFNVIVPCLMLSVLTLLTFWLPATSNEKVSLGLSVFLTYSMFMLLIAEEVPTTSESVPLIGTFSFRTWYTLGGVAVRDMEERCSGLYFKIRNKFNLSAYIYYYSATKRCNSVYRVVNNDNITTMSGRHPL